MQGLKRVEAGIRPQALRLVPPAPDAITGRVFLREPLGLEDEVLVEMADGTRVKVVTAAGEEFPEGALWGLILRHEISIYSETAEAPIWPVPPASYLLLVVPQMVVRR